MNREDHRTLLTSITYHPEATKGVPQGAPTSPILANLVMDKWIRAKGQGDIVAYADDSVSFSDHPIEPEIPEGLGISLNEEKTGYVKYEGK